MDMTADPFSALEGLLRTHANAYGKTKPGQPFNEAMRHLLRDPEVAQAARVLSAHYRELEEQASANMGPLGKGARHILLYTYKTNAPYIVSDNSELQAVEALIKRRLMVKSRFVNTFKITLDGRSKAISLLAQYKKNRLCARKTGAAR